MAVGAGKYDDVCTFAREAANGQGAIVLIIEGTHGTGFSAQLTGEMMANLPDALESMAMQIRNDLGQTLTQTASQKVERWDYFCKAIDTEGGPEDVLLTEINNQDEFQSDEFFKLSESEQLTRKLDKAIAETAAKEEKPDA